MHISTLILVSLAQKNYVIIFPLLQLGTEMLQPVLPTRFGHCSSTKLED